MVYLLLDSAERPVGFKAGDGFTIGVLREKVCSATTEFCELGSMLKANASDEDIASGLSSLSSF